MIYKIHGKNMDRILQDIGHRCFQLFDSIGKNNKKKKNKWNYLKLNLNLKLNFVWQKKLELK